MTPEAEEVSGSSTTDASLIRTGRVGSGDVQLFYRCFGAATDKPPILILHGANYYDSADWIEVGTALAVDREVVAFDARGFGASSWSPSQDYSTSAQVADIAAVCNHFGWQRQILLGHSRGGQFALRYEMEFGDRVVSLVLADWCPREGGAGNPGAGSGSRVLSASGQEVFPTLVAALAATSRDQRSLEHPAGRARFEQLLEAVPGGYVIARRDPAFRNGGTAPDPGVSVLWRTLADREQPTLIIRATQSVAVDAAALDRIRRELPQIELAEIDSGHDLAQVAPGALIEAVRRFVSVPLSQSKEKHARNHP